MRSAPAPSAVPERPRPERVGSHYQLIEQLGRGGMAVVYRALDTSRGVQLALKQAVAQKNAARDRELQALFESEFHTLAQLKHPSVIAVYDYGVDPAGPYYTMELLDGGDLVDAAPLPYRRACELMVQISSSLSLLHARGFLHRDISPRNVRYTSDGRAKLIDFGAMAAMGPCAQVVGTPAFISPEVAHRLTLDARTDLFSLGATLYFALTGRFAYPARTLEDLRDVWRQEPRPPSDFAADIPPALDELVLSLIKIDPSRRPRNAFEVMQRLAAIAGVAVSETSEVSQAYLSTPILIGRDAELAQFREHMTRAMRGQGGGLVFEAASGSGRTRMLDACVIEAKALGASVLRISGGSTEGLAFASAHELATQLCETLPREAIQAARETKALGALFEASPDASAEPQLAALADWRGERFTLQVALGDWIKRVCRDRPLMIAVDDAEKVDEASLALLAALAHAAESLAISIVAMVGTAEDEGALSLQVLRSQCTVAPLRALTLPETQALFSSVFADAPHVRLLSDRIFKVAAGSPRESMALAQHLLDKQLVRYADGNWRLPTELAASDLPRSVEDALRAKLARLSPLALRLAQTQALAVEGSWTRADYAEVAGPDAAGELDEAISSLVRAGVVTQNGSMFTLKHRETLDDTIAKLSPEARRAMHARLADLSAHSERLRLVEVHHALLAGQSERGLSRMASLLHALATNGSIYVLCPIDPVWVVRILAEALEAATRAGRPARELCELNRHLASMSIPVDTELFFRYGPAWLKHLLDDSGYNDYHATDPSAPHGDRLKAALEKTIARHAATPEVDRVYPFIEAIKHLAQWVTTAIVAGSRRSDTRLLASLPEKLEPFTLLSPLLHPLWQNIIAAGEMNYQAKPEQARARVLEVYERLKGVEEKDVPNVDSIRYAIAYALGVLEVSLGYPTAEHWIETMQVHPLQQVNAVYLRRILAIYAEDRASADKYRQDAEVLAVQASARQMFDVQVLLELAAHVQARDLTGAKQTVDRIEALAAVSPGLMSQYHLAQGCYQRLRGDLNAAREAFERCLALVDPHVVDPPPNLNVWVNGAGGYAHVLLELGRVEEARAFAEKARAICAEREISLSGWGSHIERALALAEAKLGEHERARERLDRLIEARSNLVPSRLTIDYEARARVAIMGKDQTAARHFADLAMREADGGAGMLLTKHNRLLDEAKQAGLLFEMPVTGFESSVLGSDRPEVPTSSMFTVTSALQSMPDSNARVQRALDLLCQVSKASSGYLFVVRGGVLTPVANVGEAASLELITCARDWWQEELAGADLDDIVTGDLEDDGAGRITFFNNGAGLKYRIVALKSAAGANVAYVGLVMLAVEDARELAPEYWPTSSAIVTRLLEHGDVEPVYKAE